MIDPANQWDVLAYGIFAFIMGWIIGWYMKGLSKEGK